MCVAFSAYHSVKELRTNTLDDLHDEARRAAKGLHDESPRMCAVVEGLRADRHSGHQRMAEMESLVAQAKAGHDEVVSARTGLRGHIEQHLRHGVMVGAP